MDGNSDCKGCIIAEAAKRLYTLRLEARTAVHVYEGILVIKEAFTYAVE